MAQGWKIGGIVLLMLLNCTWAWADEKERAYIEWLYQEYHQLMFAVVKKYGNAPDEWEDIVAESVVKLYQHQQTIAQLTPELMKAYIVRTVRNSVFDHLRKQKRRKEKWSEQQLEDVEEKVIQHENLRLIQQTIQTLPENERKALTYKVRDEKKDSEIAALLGLSEASVRKYIARARKKLKKAMEEIKKLRKA